jgi:hypothetical protein
MNCPPRHAPTDLVPLIAAGTAPRSVFATIAAEESPTVHSDRRSFLSIAAQSVPNHRGPVRRTAQPGTLDCGVLAPPLGFATAPGRCVMAG